MNFDILDNYKVCILINDDMDIKIQKGLQNIYDFIVECN